MVAILRADSGLVFSVLPHNIKAMEFPGFILSAFYRVWKAIRSNPCTIEMVRTPISGDGEYLRIRNDSTRPVQLFDVEFLWRQKGSKDFSLHHTPLVWVLSDRPTSPLDPGHSFEHPIDAHELGEEVTHVRIRVEHNQSNKPETKSFKVRCS